MSARDKGSAQKAQLRTARTSAPHGVCVKVVSDSAAPSQRRPTVTKYFVDKAADLDMWSSMFFEGNPARFGPGENATAGIQAFTQKSTRDERRELIKNFWQD